jgi:hypothetical protein
MEELATIGFHGLLVAEPLYERNAGFGLISGSIFNADFVKPSMRIQPSGLKLGLALLTLAVGGLPAMGAGPVRQVSGVVTDEEGRPIEEVAIEVCGEELRLPDGTWDRNHTPHCLMPRATMDKAGRFTVPLDEREVRLNLWFHKDGFAPAYVAGLSARSGEAKVVMKRGLQVSGHVTRQINGRSEPVKGAAVYLGCASGDLAYQKRVFEDPYFFVMGMKEGDDLPCLRHVFTGAFGEYVLQVAAPPKGKKWFVVCLNEIAPLDVKDGQAASGPDFDITVQVRPTDKPSSPPATSPADK